MRIQVDLTEILAEFEGMIEVNGVTSEVSLPEGPFFRVKTTSVNRQPADLTRGLQQDRSVIRVMASAWHLKAGIDRRPEKGDRIKTGGIRHAVESARPVMFQDVLVGYVITLKG